MYVWPRELLLRLLEHFFTPDDVYEWKAPCEIVRSRDKSIRCLRDGVEGESSDFGGFLNIWLRIGSEASLRSGKRRFEASGRIQQVNASLTSKTEPNHCDGAERRSAKAFHDLFVAFGFDSFFAIFGKEYFRPLNHAEWKTH